MKTACADVAPAALCTRKFLDNALRVLVSANGREGYTLQAEWKSKCEWCARHIWWVYCSCSPKGCRPSVREALGRDPAGVARESDDGDAETIAVVRRPERRAVLRVEHGDEVGHGHVDL